MKETDSQEIRDSKLDEDDDNLPEINFWVIMSALVLIVILIVGVTRCQATNY